MKLGSSGGREIRRAGRARTGGKTQKLPLLSG